MNSVYAQVKNCSTTEFLLAEVFTRLELQTYKEKDNSTEGDPDL